MVTDRKLAWCGLGSQSTPFTSYAIKGEVAMVERYLFVKLLPEHCNGEGRARAAQAALALAEHLPRGAARVGLPADDAALSAWDLSVALCFESLEHADRFMAAAAYQAFVEGYLGAHGRVVKAWTFAL